MKDYQFLLEKLFEEKLSAEDFKKLFKKLKNILKKAFNTFSELKIKIEKDFQKFYGNNYLDELTQEFILKLILNKNTLKKKKFIHENYLLFSARNFICYQLNIIKNYSEKEVKFSELLPENNSQEEKDYLVEEKMAQYMEDYLENVKVQYILSLFKEKLSKKDWEVLCWYIYKDVYNEKFFVNAKESTLYKRWERLKNKLSGILEKDFSFEEIPAGKLFEKIKSEICDKFNYK